MSKIAFVAAAVFAIVAAHAVRAAERLVGAAVGTTAAEINLYSAKDGAAVGTRKAADFPKKVVFLEDGKNGRVRIHFPDNGQEAWVRKRDVRLDLPENVRKAECEPPKGQALALAPTPTRGGRGIGEECAR